MTKPLAQLNAELTAWNLVTRLYFQPSREEAARAAVAALPEGPEKTELLEKIEEALAPLPC